MVFIGTDKQRERQGRGLWRHKRAEFHWNWPPGENVRVKAFTNCESVELFLNDVSLGRQNIKDFPQRILHWDIPFEPGTLKAVAFVNNEVKATAELQTSGMPAALQLSSETDKLKANGGDIAHVQVNIVDEEGKPVWFADNRITCTVTGPATLLGMEDANSRNVENYKDNSQAAFHGKLLLYIQSGKKSGVATITVTAEGLESDTVEMDVGG